MDETPKIDWLEVSHAIRLGGDAAAREELRRQGYQIIRVVRGKAKPVPYNFDD